ncbi:MAG: hypothetical protein ACLUNV_08165 [Sutterella wadsworthensis]
MPRLVLHARNVGRDHRLAAPEEHGPRPKGVLCAATAAKLLISSIEIVTTENAPF